MSAHDNGGPPPVRRFNHACVLAFTVISADPNGEDFTGPMLREAITKRLDLISDAELLEAVGAPYDTFEEQGIPKPAPHQYRRPEMNKPNASGVSVEALPGQWRDAAKWLGVTAVMGLEAGDELKKCADELEAALASATPCAHSWHDYGQHASTNLVYCSSCKRVSASGYEGVPYGTPASAAAPDQHETLLGVEEWIANHVPDCEGREWHLRAVRAALAKAGGES